MNDLPRSPLTTRLSGSARETELRIRNIFQWKRGRPPVWLMVLATLVALSCGSLVACQMEEAPAPDGAPSSGEAVREPQATDPAPYSGPAEAAQAFSEVLLNGAPFTLVGDQLTSYDLSELNVMIWGDPEVNAYAEQFAVADLDGDGTPEVVLLTNQHVHSEPVLILRWQDGQIYGYSEVGRGMQGLKADGVSWWSDGAFHNGAGRDQYISGENGPDRREKVRLLEFVADAGGAAEYYLGGQEVTREEYEAADTQMAAQPDARWYSFDPDIISAVFAP